MSLTERITVRDGAVRQSNFFDYQVPRMSDIPGIHVTLIPTDNHPRASGRWARRWWDRRLPAPCSS